MWRSSWLSREVIVLPAFMAAVAAWGAAHALGEPTLALGVAGAVLALALFVCTGMIYACLPFLQEWRTPLTVVNFALLGSASGLTAAAALAAVLHTPLARPYVIAALAVGALAYVGRVASLSRNARLRPKSTLATAIGVKHPRIVQIAQGAMGGSFNTREFFHGRPLEVVRAARWTLLALVFPVPALLLLSGKLTAPVLGAAFLLQYAGLLAERWYFFAEAKHPQNLYYQAIA
jgi:DMSO reductase anchor subunit